MGRSAAEPLVVHRLDGEDGRRIVPAIPAGSELGNPFVHLVRSIRAGTPPLTDGAEGRASLAVALAAYEAARTGRTVTLDTDA